MGWGEVRVGVETREAVVWCGGGVVVVAVGGGGGPSLSSRNQDVSGKTQNKNASLPFFSDSSPPLLYARCSYVYSINICVGIPLPLHPRFLDVTLGVRVGLFSELEKG